MTAPAVPPLTDQPVGKPLLLRGPLAETDLLPHSRDFQARVGRPVGPADTDATPCVVVLTRTADREIDELSVRLAALGIPLLRPDSDRCAGQSISYDLDAEVLITPGGAFRPRVGWRRYFQTSALPAATEPRLAAYARDQWLPWADTVLAGPSARVVNPAAAPDRVTQLVHARAAGLKTPATLVTTTPADAVRLIPGAGDLIVKTLGEHFVEPAPGRVTGIAPRRVSRNELAAEGGVELAPVLVQELIPCARELRIYAVAGELDRVRCEASIARGPVDGSRPRPGGCRPGSARARAAAARAAAPLRSGRRGIRRPRRTGRAGVPGGQRRV